MRNRLLTYLYWALLVGVAFFSIYPTANWLTSQRSDLYHLYFLNELFIPFIPEFIWLYISMYVLFLTPPLFLTLDELSSLGKQLIAGTLISGLIFMLFPASLGFERIVPDSPLYSQLFLGIFKIDRPHNLVPSLHVVFSTCIILAISVRVKGWFYGLLMIWLLAIMASTLLIHQHHILDVVAGLILAIILCNFYRGAICLKK